MINFMTEFQRKWRRIKMQSEVAEKIMKGIANIERQYAEGVLKAEEVPVAIKQLIIENGIDDATANKLTKKLNEVIVG